MSAQSKQQQDLRLFAISMLSSATGNITIVAVVCCALLICWNIINNWIIEVYVLLWPSCSHEDPMPCFNVSCLYLTCYRIANFGQSLLRKSVVSTNSSKADFLQWYGQLPWQINYYFDCWWYGLIHVLALVHYFKQLNIHINVMNESEVSRICYDYERTPIKLDVVHVCLVVKISHLISYLASVIRYMLFLRHINCCHIAKYHA